MSEFRQSDYGQERPDARVRRKKTDEPSKQNCERMFSPFYQSNSGLYGVALVCLLLAKSCSEKQGDGEKTSFSKPQEVATQLPVSNPWHFYWSSNSTQ